MFLDIRNGGGRKARDRHSNDHFDKAAIRSKEHGSVFFRLASPVGLEISFFFFPGDDFRVRAFGGERSLDSLGHFVARYALSEETVYDETKGDRHRDS